MIYVDRVDELSTYSLPPYNGCASGLYQQNGHRNVHRYTGYKLNSYALLIWNNLLKTARSL